VIPYRAGSERDLFHIMVERVSSGGFWGIALVRWRRMGVDRSTDRYPITLTVRWSVSVMWVTDLLL